MVRRTPPYREIAGRIVVGQASRPTEREPLIEEYAVEINTAENVGFREMYPLFSLALAMVESEIA